VKTDNKIAEAIERSVEIQMNKEGYADNLIYDTIVEVVRKGNFCEIKEIDVSGPIKTFLNNWGLMGWVLARWDEDWESQLARGIRENCGIFEKFRALHLEDCDIDGMKSEIEGCYAAVKSIVKATSASKVLHLLNCNFFPLWDVAIRREANNKFKNKIGRIDDSTEGYFNFMFAIQVILRQYDKILSMLSERYKKPKLRILDMFLWNEAHKNRDKEND